ncbi:SDR family oxidoreductase [Chitinophaga japonensis]|uniref:Putative oxidoreductase n=1 Tax=Chitinophaga japonensis TaxID=104662 RepID=A0A562SIU6_CHIJA|nr:SDR family NAD(P)-dependent oxidoreductase [Chitinophaga japonensis]TWI80914.1 putative oxidoreductase [Chitinophaga japonensis]
MKTQNNTMLVTGGSAGIGFAIAKLFNEKGNKVIITGRDASRLEQAAAQLPGVTPLISDVTSEADVDKLVETLRTQFPALNVLVNNAGYAAYYQLAGGGENWPEAQAEMHTNYLSLVRLTEKLLPLLQQQPAAAVVNVSSIVAYAPGLRLPTYSASKAAVHAYTRVLRLALQDTPVKVFELMPPLVNTSFSAAIGGENGIPPETVAQELLAHMERDEYSIHVGDTANIYALLRESPDKALLALNGIPA